MNLIALVAYVRLTAICQFHLVFHYLIFQKHYKHNVFNPFQTNPPVMFSVSRILAPYVDTSGINFYLFIYQLYLTSITKHQQHMH